MELTSGLREQKKLKAREAIVEAALALFATQGFEGTTVDQIAARAGVSRRSFFRYFETKEAVAFPERAARLERFKALIVEHAERGGAYMGVREAFLAIAAEYMLARRQIALENRVVAASPTLIAHELTLDRDWQQAIAEALSGELRDAAAERRARVQAGAIMGVVRAALSEWFERGCKTDLVTLGAESLDLLEQGFPADAKRARAPRGRNEA